MARRILRPPQRSLIEGRPAIRCGGLLLAVSPVRIAIRSTMVYDMYPWDSASSAGPGGQPLPTPATPQQRAVQFALDRRDNGGDALSAPGGDALSAPGQPPASPARQ